MSLVRFDDLSQRGCNAKRQTVTNASAGRANELSTSRQTRRQTERRVGGGGTIAGGGARCWLQADKFFSRRNKDLVGHGSVQDGNIAAWWQGHAMFTEITSGFNDRRPLLIGRASAALLALLSSFSNLLFGTHTTRSSLVETLSASFKRSSPLFLAILVSWRNLNTGPTFRWIYRWTYELAGMTGRKRVQGM